MNPANVRFLTDIVIIIMTISVKNNYYARIDRRILYTVYTRQRYREKTKLFFHIEPR